MSPVDKCKRNLRKHMQLHGEGAPSVQAYLQHDSSSV